MTRAWFSAGLLLCACNGGGRPTGPPPEYEKPTVMPWDAGAPVDPLANIEGEAVTDDEPSEPPDAGGVGDAAPEAGDAAVEGKAP